MGFHIHLLQKANDPDLNFLQAFPLLLESLYSSQLSNSSIPPLLPQAALQPLETLVYLIRYKCTFCILNQVWLLLAEFLSSRILLDWCVKGCPRFAAAEGMPQELHCEQRFHSKDVEFPEPHGKDCPSLHGLPGRQNNGGVPVNSLGYKDLIEEIVLFLRLLYHLFVGIGFAPILI